MANWQAIVGGVTYNLSDRNPFDVVSVTGVGIAPARRLTQRGPLQHGETDIGFRLDPRNVNLVLAVKAASRAAADTARDTLMAIFKPRENTPIQLRCTRDDGAVRQIDCYATGLVDMPITDNERIGSFQRVGVQLVSADPTWYLPTESFNKVVTNPTGWHLAGGLIDEDDVLAIGENITSPTDWDSASSDDEPVFSIVVQTGTTTSASGVWRTGNSLNRIVLNADTSDPFTPKWRIRNIDTETTILTASAAIPSSDVLLTATCDGSHSAKFYHDTTLVGSGTMSAGGVIPAGINAGQWHSASGVFTMPIVAAYKIALTTTQIQGIIDVLSNPTTTRTAIITNTGNTDSFPTITIEGPVTNPVITNTTIGESLSLVVTLEDDEIIIIDTRYGHKTIVDGAGNNQMSILSPASDLASFRLVQGDNMITVEVDDDVYTATASLAWQNRYMGL